MPIAYCLLPIAYWGDKVKTQSAWDLYIEEKKVEAAAAGESQKQLLFTVAGRKRLRDGFLALPRIEMLEFEVAAQHPSSIVPLPHTSVVPTSSPTSIVPQSSQVRLPIPLWQRSNISEVGAVVGISTIMWVDKDHNHMIQGLVVRVGW